MTRTAHVDTFTRDNLPPRGQWPELLFELPELRYPERLNCAAELVDRWVRRGRVGRVALRDPVGQQDQHALRLRLAGHGRRGGRRRTAGLLAGLAAADDSRHRPGAA